MRPMPKKMLIHCAVLVTEYAPDLWGNASELNAVPLDRVRIEGSHRTVMTKDRQQITLSAVLFFDCTNSSSPIPFLLEGETHDSKIVKNQFVEWNGKRYAVQSVEPLYDEKKIHHYEVGLV